jgi:acyl dehydratase
MTASSGSAGMADVVADRPPDESDDAVEGKSLVAHFTKRDLVLYALGIGCCGDGDEDDEDDEDDEQDDDARDRELRYVYEGHRDFGAFPSFLLSLPFVATRCRRGGGSEQQPASFGVRPFPPEFMAHRLDEDGSSSICGPLPGRFYRDARCARDAVDLPILHVSQSLTLHDEDAASFVRRDGDAECGGGGGGGPVDPPTRMRLETSITSVAPRRIGTFVTSATTYHRHDGRRVASSRMVALILGLDPDAVVPFGTTTERDRRAGNAVVEADDEWGGDDVGGAIGDSIASTTVVRYRIPKNAALLYRLSGDYNPIHVVDPTCDDDAGSRGGRRRPVLHGLCTLGYSLRAVLRHAHRRGGRRRDGDEEPRHRRRERNEEAARLHSVRCDFVGPVFANDVLRVEVRDGGGEGMRPMGDGGGSALFDVRFRVFREERRRRGDDRGGGAINIKEDHRDVVVVDKGRAQFRLTGSGSEEVVGAVSRL